MGRGDIGDPVVLQIAPSVLWSNGSIFSDRSLGHADCQRDNSPHFLDNNVRFDLLGKRYFELDEKERPLYLAEVLIPGKIPIEAIIGGSDYLQEAIDRKKAFNAAVDNIKFISCEGNAAKAGDKVTLQWDLSPVGQFLKSAEISQGNKPLKTISLDDDLAGEAEICVTHNLRFHLKIETTCGDTTRDIEVKKVDEIMIKAFSIDCAPEASAIRLSWNVSGADTITLVGYGDQNAAGEFKTNAEPGTKFTLRTINQIETRDITIEVPAGNGKKRHIGKRQGYAVVSFADKKKDHVVATFGNMETTNVNKKVFGGKVSAGTIFKFSWDEIDYTKKVTSFYVIDKKLLPTDVDYIKTFRGIVKRNEGQSFAFVKGGGVTSFIAPDIVNRLGLVNGSACNFVVTTTFNNKRGNWGWSCVSAEKVDN